MPVICSENFTHSGHSVFAIEVEDIEGVSGGEADVGIGDRSPPRFDYVPV